MNRQLFNNSEGRQGRKSAGKEHRILMAEDDKEMRSMLLIALNRAGYDVVECSDGMGLLSQLEPFILEDGLGQRDVDLIISDILMPGLTGMEMLEGAPKNEGFPPVILITAFGDDETHRMAEKFGAVALFDKPFDMDDLLIKVHDILELRKTGESVLAPYQKS